MTGKEKNPETLPEAAETAQEVQEQVQQEQPAARTGTQEAQEPIRLYVNLEGAKNPEDMTPEELEQWRQQLPEAMRRTRESLDSTIKAISATISNAMQFNADVLKPTFDAMRRAAQAVASFYTSETYKTLQKTFSDFAEWMQGVSAQFSAADLLFVADFGEDIEDLLPLIQEELEAVEQENGGEEISFTEFMRNTDPETGEPIKSIFERCLDRAKERKETAEAATRLAADLPRLQSVIPTKHTMPNNYLANELQHGGIIDAGRLNLPVLGDGKQARRGGELITTAVIATYQPGEGVTIKGNFTEYDRQVQDAICSLWEYGDIDHTFTPAMVYRAMTNGKDTAAPSPQQIGAVTRSIEKQRHIFVQVDASAEFEKRGITDANGKPIRFKVDDYLLSLKGLEVTAGGKTVKGYYIKEAPLLLTYSRMTKQLLTVKSDLLDIRRIDSKGCICESVSNTESRITIKGYLLRRIEILKYDIARAKDNCRKYRNRRKKDPTLPEKQPADFMQQSNRVLFETIFAETGQTSTNREIQRRNRDYAMQCLDYWKATEHIKGYSVVKGERGAIRGIDLQI